MRSMAPAGGRAMSLGGSGRGLVNLFRDLRGEIRRVVWPTPRQAVNMTAVVVALSAGLGAFLGLVDFGFQELFRILLQAAGAGGY
jgi:preprotein translocase subunit SecE